MHGLGALPLALTLAGCRDQRTQPRSFELRMKLPLGAQSVLDEHGFVASLQERIDDAIDAGRIDACRFERSNDRAFRKPGLLLRAREALFTCGKKYAAIFDERGGCILVER